jgi:cell fate regulator YaaT (PSP1 superfamily)
MNERRRLEVVGSDEPRQAGTYGWLNFEMDLADPEPPVAGALLHNVAGVRLETGRVTSHDAGDQVYPRGAKVVCEGQLGVEWGVVVVPSRRLLAKAGLPRILRAAADDDRAAEAEVRAREQAVYVAARRAVLDLELPVKVVRAEWVREGQRYTIYFASEERGSFRELLVRVSQATGQEVELRQVGMRDAAKVVGGVGPCGLQLCCNTFLSDFAPITIKMAKDQGLGVNPQKLSGVCGRLLCCLVYEEAYYRAQRLLVPRLGERVGTDRGEGKVRDVDVLQMLVKVTLDSGESITRPVDGLVREGQVAERS